MNNIEKYLNALREIDTHIRSTQDPIPYIVSTLQRVLPEYKSCNTCKNNCGQSTEWVCEMCVGFDNYE